MLLYEYALGHDILKINIRCWLYQQQNARPVNSTNTTPRDSMYEWQAIVTVFISPQSSFHNRNTVTVRSYPGLRKWECLNETG